jgi:hypothetical protein
MEVPKAVDLKRLVLLRGGSCVEKVATVRHALGER